MNRILKIALLSGFTAALWAQTAPVTSVRIGSDTVPWARFMVDGASVQGMQTFTWPVGSKHVLEAMDDLPYGANNCPANLAAAVQISTNAEMAILFSGWVDNKGLLVPSGSRIMTFTADPTVTSLVANFSVEYRVVLNFFQGMPNTDPVYCQPPSTAGAPWDNIPPDQLRSGIMYLDGIPYWNSAIVYLPSGSHVVNAFPAPGFTFDGWILNGGPINPFLATINIASGGMTLTPQFRAAKRVRFITNPMGLNVLVDHTPVPTVPYLNVGLSQPCPGQYTRPPNPPPGISPLCLGDFDFAPGSVHIIGAPTPQLDINGKLWVFDNWGADGGGQNTPYTVDNNLASMDMPSANFLQGANAYFSTNPNNLPLTIDGRSNWPYPPVFSWAIGSTHSLSAAPAITDTKGRKYTFKSWSTGGSASQQLTVSQNDVNNSIRMVANYDVLSRLIVQASDGSVAVLVDGSPCPAPCYVDRPNGSQIRVTVPSSVAVNDSTRLDFVSWSDNGSTDHVVTLNSDTQVLTANYQSMLRLTAMGNPSNGATFQFNPVAPDMFYPAGQPVNVTAQVNPGFKFRRWAGDMSGSYPSGMVSMAQPSTVIAQLDTIPYIAPAGIQNAAGQTPDQVVAPGSLISILGASLTTDTVTGPTNPLAQTLAGVVVTVTDRMLPLVSVSPTQVTAQLPPDMPEGNYSLTVSSTGQPDVNGTFTVARNAPGLFTWSTDSRPIALANHQDGTPITPDSPAIQGETVTVYGTGFGPCQQTLIAGFLSQNPNHNPLIDSLSIQLDSFQPTASFAGAATDHIGMEITQFQITPDMPSGTNLELKVTVNGRVSNTVLLPL